MWVNSVLQSGQDERLVDVVKAWWKELRGMWEDCSKEENEMRSREGMERLGNVVMGALLIADARRDGNEVARMVAEMWIEGVQGGTSAASWEEQARRDRAAVFGTEEDGSVKARL